MAITPLRIPDRFYGQPIPVAPDMNQVVDKVDELVDAVNTGLATSNAIVGGDKYVPYTSSQTYGVPADALTLDRLDAATVLPGTMATVINPHPTPLTATAPSAYYRATIVPAGTAGAVLVPAFTGSPDTVPVVWVELVDNSSFTPLLPAEVNVGKAAYTGLELRPLLIALVNGAGTGSTTVVTTPATQAPAAGPTVTGFLPATAAEGASVTLTGTGFSKATAVLFNGTPASFQLVNATTLVAVVPVGATTGPLSVTNSAGTGTSTASFTVKETVVVTPTPSLTAALAISVASIVAGSSPVAFSVTPSGGTSPYAYEVVATDNSTGQQFTLGTASSGSWTPTVAGSYGIQAKVTDSSSPAKTASSAIRYLQVVQATNRIPVADAGQDVTMQLPTSSVALMGTASDPDTGDTLTYAWRQITGPSSAGGLPATTLNVVASSLVAGTYQFGFRSTDNHGAQSPEDYVLVTVQAAVVTNEVDMLALYGQSNELSNADRAAAKYAPLTTLGGDFDQVFANVRILNTQTNQLESLHDGVNTRPAEDGSYPTPASYHTSDAGVWQNGVPSQKYTFEVLTRAYFIAKRHQELYPGRQLVLVQGAVGGVPRSRFLKANNDLYPRFVNMINRAKQLLAAEGKTVRFRAIDCTQGETDQDTAISTFNAQLRQIWSDLQTDVATSETQFIEFGIPPTGDTGTYVVNPHNNTKATWAGEQARQHYFTPDFVALEEDRIHWNAASQAYAAYLVIATAFGSALGFPAALSQVAPTIAFNATTGMATITPLTSDWLMREFYYQCGSDTPRQLINSWAVPVTRTMQPGEFKAWSRAVPGRSQSPNATNSTTWTVNARPAVASGLAANWQTQRGVGTSLSGNTLTHASTAPNGWTNYAPAFARLKPLPATFVGEYLRIKFPTLARLRAAITAGICITPNPTTNVEIVGVYQDTVTIGLKGGDGNFVPGFFDYTGADVGPLDLIFFANVPSNAGYVRLVRPTDASNTSICGEIPGFPSEGAYIVGFCYGNPGWEPGQEASTLDGVTIVSDFLEQAFV